MTNKKSSRSGRAWRLLRLALLWARKGGALKHTLMIDLRMALRSIRGRDNGKGNRIHYMERELSFEKTPLFNIKIHRPTSMRLPKIPCLTPSVESDGDGDEWVYEKKAAEAEAEEESYFDEDEDELDIEVVEEEKGIDSKAEEFIEKFYDQMKLQRQISLLRYNEMLYGGMA